YKNMRGLFGLIQLYKDPKTGKLREQAIIDDFNEYTDLISLISYLFSPIIGGITGYFSVKEKPRNADAVIAEIEEKYRIMDRTEYMLTMNKQDQDKEDKEKSKEDNSHYSNIINNFGDVYIRGIPVIGNGNALYFYELDDLDIEEDNIRQQDPYMFDYV
ncbi:MAG: hypothetical protein J7K26_03415, partial [Candidatus Aenigmarchaeota archaeon]|nr:hypothetical protein [Candidatus Aenigmarchaeota archaeon]